MIHFTAKYCIIHIIVLASIFDSYTKPHVNYLIIILTVVSILALYVRFTLKMHIFYYIFLFC